jgi:UDP-N-acetylglucosamine 4,6-dehydratase/5-epimerase
MAKQNLFNNKTLLITGGTGSFGKEVLTRFLGMDVKEIRIFSRDEKKQDDMRRKFNNSKIKFYIGDVRDKRSVDYAMSGVDYVFHAAALKQVPSCEFFPMEAVKTNVLGTENVLDSAIQSEVKRVVVLSTDKAVYPINAMGMSKAMMEKVMIAKARTIDKNIVICGTRYGNVMASRGSVIPLFIEQIKDKKDLTITDPSMTRFMMTLEDAVDLVLYAFSEGKSGDIFVKKAPASTVGDLAQALIELYRSNSKVRIIGIRHGEKTYESLVNREDMINAQDIGNYYRIPADNRNLNYEQYFTEGYSVDTKITEYNSHNTNRLNIEDTKKILLKLKTVRYDLGLNNLG